MIDARGESEYLEGHIPGSWNIHTGYLLDYLHEIPTDKTVVVSCESGARSSIASSVLQRAGLTNIVNFPQGFAGWKASGAPIETEVPANA